MTLAEDELTISRLVSLENFARDRPVADWGSISQRRDTKFGQGVPLF